MSATSISDQVPNIVIVGSGNGGLVVWNLLARRWCLPRCTVTLITPQPYYIHRLAVIRAVITDEGSFEDQGWMPLGDKFNSGNRKLVIGSVTAIVESDDKSGQGYVALDNGEKVPYTYLVLATGSAWEGHIGHPADKPGMKSWVSDWRKRFDAVKSVVIVGGGAIGVETAAEVKEYFPDTTVTIVHGREELMNEAYPDWWRKRLTEKLRAFGVDLVLEDYVDQEELSPDNTLRTRKGIEIKAEMLIHARGPKPVTDFIKSSFGSESLSSSGFVKVHPTLQLVDHPRIFALGDIIDWKERKLAHKAERHAGVVVKNLVLLLNGCSATAEYRGTTEIIVVAIGKAQGYGYVGALWGLELGDALCVWIKSADLATKLTRRHLCL